MHKSWYVLCQVSSGTPHFMIIAAAVNQEVAPGIWLTIQTTAAAMDMGLLPSHGGLCLQHIRSSYASSTVLPAFYTGKHRATIRATIALPSFFRQNLRGDWSQWRSRARTWVQIRDHYNNHFEQSMPTVASFLATNQPSLLGSYLRTCFSHRHFLLTSSPSPCGLVSRHGLRNATSP